MVELRLGIAGLGAASRLVLPAFATLQDVRLAAAAEPREDARAAFAAAHNLPVFADVEALCRSSEIDAIWIETPNHLHCEHAILAAQHGKHVICAKPMATSLEECDRMIAAAHSNGVRLLIGHSKIFDPPIRVMGELARERRLGKTIQIDIWLYNDWLRRPRLAEELDEARGAGFILRQAPHVIDIAHYIAAAPAKTVRALTGSWDANLPGAGNCAVLIGYESGAIASISLNGYGYFDTGELNWGIGTMGELRPDPLTTKPRPRQSGPLKEAEKYAAAPETDRKAGAAMPFFGLSIVSCERGVMRQSPGGILVYTDDGCEEIAVPATRGRAAELIELRDALREGRDVFPNGAWGRSNLETCLAILASASEGRDIALR